MKLSKFRILAIIFFLSIIQVSAQTKVIAHRGFSGVAPENTLLAFQKAIDIKTDYFELDVHKTLDGSLVVIHDLSVDRTSSNEMKGEIAKMNYSDIRAVRVGNSEQFGDKFKNEKIPTLNEALELAKGKIKVCIEIKVLGVEEEVLRIVNELKMKKQVIVFSFDYRVLAKIRKLDKKIPILYLINDANIMTVDYAKMIKANAIGVGYGTPVTSELLDFAHKSKMEIWKWTVNSENEMEQLIAVGLDGLITDYPDKALKIRNIKVDN